MVNQDIGIIIQARMSSRRFPGKSLHKLAGRPMISYILDSMEKVSGHPRIVLATSDEKSDDPLAEFVAREGVECFRGSLDDVYRRFCDALRFYKFDAFVRINGDSPLMDYRLVNRAIELYEEKEADLVTNALPRSYPKGQSVEIISSKAFLAMEPVLTDKEDREHITQHFHKNAHDYKIASFISATDYSQIQMSVDEKEDAEVIDELIQQMDMPHWHYSYEDMAVMQRKILANIGERRKNHAR